MLLSAPFVFYKRTGPRMRAFCITMATKPKRRKKYKLILAIAVLLFNYTFFALDGASLWQVPGLALGFVMVRDKAADAILQWLHADRVILGIAFGLWLLSLTVPELYPMSASMGLVISSAMFYPSRTILEQASLSQSCLEFQLTDKDLVSLYF